MCATLIARRPGRSSRRRSSPRDDEHVDREVLRRSTFRRRAAHHFCERRAKLLLHEALEGLTRLPDVVDVVALLALADAVDDQPLRRLVFPDRGGVAKHLLGDSVVDLQRELRRCRQDSNRHLASFSAGGRPILGRYVEPGQEGCSTPAQTPTDGRSRSSRRVVATASWPEPGRRTRHYATQTAD